jgi:hypothetical protein
MRLGVPMRSASASTWAGRSRLPLSSLASMSTTQRAWAQPACRAASMAVKAAKVEYPSSAPPRP